MIDFLRETAGRVRSFFLKQSREGDLSGEFAAHLDFATAENIRQGMPADEARRKALIDFGGVQPAKELHRDARGLPALESVLQDLRYTFRALRRDAGFTFFAILIVGLGIAGSTVVFSVLNTLLVRPLPFHNPDKLVWIANDNTQAGLSGETAQVNPFLELKQRNHSFTDVAGYYAFYGIGDSKLIGQGEPERLSTVPVTENFFSILGIKPAMGRLFNPQECKWNGPKAVLMSNGLWKRRFASDPNIVGRELTMDGGRVTVVGVLPRSFDFGSIFAPGTRVDLYSPFPLSGETNRYGNTLAIIARLKPGVTAAAARSDARRVSALATRAHREWNDFVPALMPLSAHISGKLRPALLVLASAVAVVMLIVCANLCNLLLARTATRQKEIAVRTALGAGRRRLIRQLLTESVVLSCCGAALGALLAAIGVQLLSHLNAISIPLLDSVHLDARTLLFTLIVAIATGILFGLIPALQVRDVNVNDGLKESSRGSSEGRRHSWIRNTLVIAEVAFACMLLVGAGLLMRSFLRVLDVNLGFQPERAATMRIDPSSTYSTQAQRNTYFDEALRRVKAIPGVHAAGLTDALPLGRNRSWGAGVKGVVYARNEYPSVFPRIISDGYFKAMGIPIIAGRDFSERDAPSTEQVVVINQTMARSLWPGQNALGKFLQADRDRRVVGIVGDVRHLALEQGSGNEMYLPIRQCNDYQSVDLVVRTTLPPNGLAYAIRTTLKTLDPNLPGNDFRSLQTLVDKAVSPRRFFVILLSGFSLFALILASLGIYAVISYSVEQRTQEIGIRMALGASAGLLQKQILFQTLKLAAAGMFVGILGSALLTQALSGLLFGVTANDPPTFAGMLIVLTAVAALAGYIPAYRASRIHPMTALRVG